MKKLTLTVAAFCLLGALPAAAADQSYHTSTDVTAKDNGDYTAKTKEKGTDAAGTDTNSMKKESVSTGLGGGVTSETSSTDVSDPKGLGNKSKTTSEEKVVDKKDGDATGTKTTETKAPGATDKTTTKASISTDHKGLKTKKVTKKAVHDPKGLMNKETTTSTDTATQKADGTTEVEHVVKDNGKTTAKTDTTVPSATTPATAAPATGAAQ